MANWIENLKKKIKEYFAGQKDWQRINTTQKTIQPEKKFSTGPDFKTVRTQAIEDELRKAGIDEKTIARLRGKIKR